MKSRRIKSLRLLTPIALIALVAALAGCGGGGAAKLDSGDVAVVGSEHVTQAMYAAALAEAKASLEAQGQTMPQPGSTGFQQVKTNVVDLLVQQAELALEAKNLGVTVSDAAVQTKLDALKKKYYGGSDKRYLAGLKQQGFTDAQFREYIREHLLETKLYAAITKSATTTKQAIDAYYAANLTQYQQPATRAVQEILVGKNKESLANQLYTQLKNGGDFAALAKKYSKDPGSKDKGGNFTATQGSDVPEFDKAVFATTAKTNELLKPVNTSQYGWFVIKPVGDIKAAKTTPESKARSGIQKTLQTQEQQKVAAAWMQNVVKHYCSGSNIAYQSGYAPSPDPCATLAAPDQTTT
jgi:parvulin-like peptidyl-prolyl isomerase